MKIWLLRIGLVLALGFVVISFTNASWLAEAPGGRPTLIANRGIAQYFDRSGVSEGTCTATLIEQPIHSYLENTAESLGMARAVGGMMQQIDIVPTKDGKIAVFQDSTLDCRTEGTGPVSGKTMAELKMLDIGYGYTADGGKSFPLRGKGIGAMPELAEVLRALPRTPILYHFSSNDPAEADLLAAALKAAGRDVDSIRDGFFGDPAPIARIRQLFPKAWAWSTEAAEQCSSDYVLTGWAGVMPESCRNGTMIIPLNRQWKFWGWPNRLLARMEEVGGTVVVAGPTHSGDLPAGLSLPEQLGKVPSSFNGYIQVDDIWTIGPALHPRLERRGDDDLRKAQIALEARRAKQ